MHGSLNMYSRVCIIGIIDCFWIETVNQLAIDHDCMQRRIIRQDGSSEVDTIVLCITVTIVHRQIEIVRGLLHNYGVGVVCTCETNKCRTLADGVIVGSATETLQIKIIYTNHLEITSAVDRWLLEMNGIGCCVAIFCSNIQNTVLQIHCLTIHLLDKGNHRQLLGDNIVLSYLRV